MKEARVASKKKRRVPKNTVRKYAHRVLPLENDGSVVLLMERIGRSA
jgi:hypothetical protein